YRDRSATAAATGWSCRRPRAKTGPASARGAASIHSPCLFDILGLFAELVDHRLKRKTSAGQCDIGGFRAQRVGLAVEFLGQKIELAAHALTLRDQCARVLHM